jgi:heterodisulfide reductase subunit A
VVEVEEKMCIGCGACVEACTYGVLELSDTKQGKKVVVNPVLCKGDGLCCARCPTGAISLKHYTDEELLSQIDAAVPEEEALPGEEIVQHIDEVVGDVEKLEFRN